jgi:hypothetical protein
MSLRLAGEQASGHVKKLTVRRAAVRRQRQLEQRPVQGSEDEAADTAFVDADVEQAAEEPGEPAQILLGDPARGAAGAIVARSGGAVTVPSPVTVIVAGAWSSASADPARPSPPAARPNVRKRIGRIRIICTPVVRLAQIMHRPHISTLGSPSGKAHPRARAFPSAKSCCRKHSTLRGAFPHRRKLC